MRFTQYGDVLRSRLGSFSGCSFIREEHREYGAQAQRAREAATNALRAENEKLGAERDEREQAKEREREKTHGPRVRFDLLDGLHPSQVDDAIARGRRAGDIGHRTVAFYLADCADRGLYQDFGHSSVISYAVKRHRISRRSARNLIATGRALRELQKIDRAFVENELSWSTVRAIARVADLDTEEHWLAFAKTHTIEEIEKAAARAKKGEKPREDRKGFPEVRFDVRLRVGVLLHEQYLLARQRLGAEAGRDVTDEDFAGALLEAFLRRPTEGTQSSDSLYRVVLDLNPADGTAAIRSQDGPVPIDAATAEAICCDAGILTEDGKAHGHHAPPISESLRLRILARDGYRCRVCGSRDQLHVHHIVWRSKHGLNAWRNLMAACTDCHTLVHGGFLTITGRAPDGLEIRDRKGELLTDPARVLGDAARTCLEISAAPPPATAPETREGGGPAGPSDSGFSAAKPGFLATVPTGPIDVNWFARHEHLLSFEATNATLKLEPGRPRDQVSVVREDEARYAADGDAGRPTTFETVVGQKEAVDRLCTFAQASRKSGRTPPPALLVGDSGLGKTTLARAYAHELGARLKVIDTSTLENPLGLIRQMVDVRDGDAVFLDEIHALPKALVECFYPAIEDGVMPIRFADGIAIKTVSFVLPKIAWIAATTSPERMAHAFRGRFRVIELRPYAHDDLVEIIRRASARVGRAIASEASELLAKAAGGNARGAIGLSAEARAHADARGGEWITVDDARNALRLAQLDQNGIGPVHRRILDVLRWYGRPMAAQRLCSQVGITVRALRTIYEPALVRSGAVTPTPRGMMLGATSGTGSEP